MGFIPVVGVFYKNEPKISRSPSRHVEVDEYPSSFTSGQPVQKQKISVRSCVYDGPVSGVLTPAEGKTVVVGRPEILVQVTPPLPGTVLETPPTPLSTGHGGETTVSDAPTTLPVSSV